MTVSLINEEFRAFLAERRTATLATVAPDGQPRLVPICFVLGNHTGGDAATVLYSPLDEKPKRGVNVRELARVRDIRARPAVTLLFDRWSEDWSRLAWLRARGNATLLEPHEDVETHAAVVRSLRAKYPQYHEQRLEAAPLIRVLISEAVTWVAFSDPSRLGAGAS